MAKNCKKCGVEFDIADSSVCFDCNKKAHFCVRNERILYSRKCDATGVSMVSMFPQNSPYKVYKSDFWHGDKWDGLDYGRDFDFLRSFFEQFNELKLVVPKFNLFSLQNENSDYCNITGWNKNCYLVFGGDYNQDTQYGTLCFYNENSFDIDYSDKCKESYFLNDSGNLYACRYAFDSENCHDCAYISDCTGCSECILCTNLVRKSYCILNQQYSKEEYFEKKKSLINGSYKQREENLKTFLKLRDDRIVKSSHKVSSENCTGDYVKNSKNCEMVFDIFNSEDVSNAIMVVGLKDAKCTDYAGHGSELLFDSMTVAKCHNVSHSFSIMNSSDIFYCDTLFSCHDCFGCTGLKNKQYCILNKQYSKEDYEILKAKIIESMRKNDEWGEFFPANLSCFGYNESTANLYYPLSKEEAVSQGFKWAEISEKPYQGENYILAEELPDDINDVTEDILNKPIMCAKSKKLFKITPKEFAFYKRYDLPIPRLHSEERHAIRLAMRNPKKLWKRNCMKCGKGIETSYAPERKEKVYCEDCYLKEVY